MLLPEVRRLSSLVLDLFAKSSGIPIALYELNDRGEIEETIRADENLFPPHCHAVWQLNQHQGKKACNANMCQRAGVAFKTHKAVVLQCHAGLTNISEPILVNGQAVAIIQYGAFLIDDGKPVAHGIDLHQSAMRDLQATDQEAEHIKELLEQVPHRTPIQLEWLRHTLPPIVGQIIFDYVTEIQNERNRKRFAEHDLHLRLQSALALAENHQAELPPDSALYSSAQSVTSAIAVAASVQHNLEHGRYLPGEYSYRPESVKGFVDEARTLCQAEAQKRGIDFVFDLQPRERNVKLEVSLKHLVHVFYNLLQNAVKYSYHTATNSSQRFVSVRGKMARDGYEIVISNYGVGIEPDELVSIFEPGYKGRLTQSEYRSGSGLGLALAKQIVERHHGTITPSSDPVGEPVDGVRPYLTKFALWLPFKQPRTDSKEQEARDA